MWWISSPNSYHIKISKSSPTKYSWKKTTHTHFGHPSHIKAQTHQIWAAFRLSEKEEKRWSRCCQQRTVCRNNASHQKTRCPYQRHCSLPFCSHCSPCQKTTDMSCKLQRISAQPILMQTNRDIQTTTYFSLNHAMRSRPFARIKEAEETPTLGLPIRFFAPNVKSHFCSSVTSLNRKLQATSNKQWATSSNNNNIINNININNINNFCISGPAGRVGGVQLFNIISFQCGRLTWN